MICCLEILKQRIREKRDNSRILNKKFCEPDAMPWLASGRGKLQLVVVDVSRAHFNGDPKLEEKIKNDLAVTVRCIPLDGQDLCDDDGQPGTCPFTGEPSARRVVWAKSY